MHFISKKHLSTLSKKLVTNTKEVKLNSYMIDNDSTSADKDHKQPVMVFLHGLYGNSNNWRSISYSDAIRGRRRALLIDLRNHGESDHHSSMSYPEMSEDVINHLDSLKINKFTLLGHSMGAKIAMNLSVKFPERLDGLIIVDAAPKDHKENVNIYSSINQITNYVSSMNLEGKNRKEILEELKNKFGGPVANLLNTNLTYLDNQTDKVGWRINIKAIKENLDKIISFESEPGKVYKGPLKILIGEKSHYFPADVYKEIFPDIKESDIAVIQGAGHWVHADQPSQVIIQISKFLDRIDNKI